MTDVWTLGAAEGELFIHTGVSGRAARMGHRLVIAMNRWQATVNWADGRPVTAELVVEVDSFEVRGGEGGVKGLSGAEKAVVKSNAMKSLSADRYPQIRFEADQIDEIDDGYRLTGTLRVRGKAREHAVELRTEDLGDAWRMSTESAVRQSEYGIKPFSMLLGAMQVANEVTVSFTAEQPKQGGEG